MEFSRKNAQKAQKEAEKYVKSKSATLLIQVTMRWVRRSVYSDVRSVVQFLRLLRLFAAIQTHRIMPAATVC